VKPYEIADAKWAKDDPTIKSCPECTLKIPTDAKRCPECTAVLTA
jgi:hypothetical protein